MRASSAVRMVSLPDGEVVSWSYNRFGTRLQQLGFQYRRLPGGRPRAGPACSAATERGPAAGGIESSRCSEPQARVVTTP